jgi:hypothetical protein
MSNGTPKTAGATDAKRFNESGATEVTGERTMPESHLIGGRELTTDKAIELLWRYKRALEGLTPGGSEFVNDPEFCAAYVRKQRESQHGTILRLVHEKRRR